MKDLGYSLALTTVGLVLGMLFALGMTSTPEQRAAAELREAVEESMAAPRWRAVQYNDGSYGVALCTTEGKCPANRSGTTGYKYDNAEDAKDRAASLERNRNRNRAIDNGEITMEVVP